MNHSLSQNGVPRRQLTELIEEIDMLDKFIDELKEMLSESDELPEEILERMPSTIRQLLIQNPSAVLKRLTRKQSAMKAEAMAFAAQNNILETLHSPKTSKPPPLRGLRFSPNSSNSTASSNFSKPRISIVNEKKKKLVNEKKGKSSTPVADSWVAKCKSASESAWIASLRS